MSSTTCGNCDAPLTGPYCAHCGQHAHESARSLGALFHDAWHLITHVDGRLWTTLATLLTQPGRLTRDYFAGRRARHLPPFRLYFVLSLLFFGLASVSEHLHPSGAIAHRDLTPADVAGIRADLQQAGAAAPAIARHLHATDSGIDVDVGPATCDRLQLRWLQAEVRAACRRQIADSGKSMAHAFRSYIPKMMFVFLPLVALVMVPLYWTSHYYVEHLVFFLHTHAALFLAMMLDMLLELLSHALAWLNALAALGGIALSCYAVWYVYRSMRRFYGEGRAATLGKLAVISLSYLTFLAVMMAATLLISALTA